MRRKLGTALAAALLAGCTTGASSGPFCPALVPYPAEVQAAAAAELATLPRASALARLVDDYGALRARIRGACRTEGNR